MPTIHWITNQPSQDTTASSVDDTLRSSQATIALGFGEFMHWPGSAASPGDSTSSTGDTLLGTARSAEFASVAISGTSDGFISIVTDTSSDLIPPMIVHTGTDNNSSNSTSMVGHGLALECPQARETSGKNTARWVMQTGSTSAVDYIDAGPRTITFPQAYAVAPVVVANFSDEDFNIGVYDVTATNFVSDGSWIKNTSPLAVGGTLNWMSVGTVAF